MTFLDTASADAGASSTDPSHASLPPGPPVASMSSAPPPYSAAVSHHYNSKPGVIPGPTPLYIPWAPAHCCCHGCCPDCHCAACTRCDDACHRCCDRCCTNECRACASFLCLCLPWVALPVVIVASSI